MKYSVLLYLSLAACLFTGCYEDEPQEEAREVQRITFRTDDNSWTSTRSVADGKERKFHMASEDGSKYMSMTVSEEPMTGRAATRGAQASSASISTFGVSGSLCMRNSSYTAVGCGSLFYNEEVAPGISMDYAWPTSDYKLSFFAYYPYGNDNLTMRSLATEKGIPAYSYTVPEDAADHVDVMTANVLDMLGGQQTPVNLSFQHRLAAIRFRLTNTGDNPMIVKSVTIAGVKYTGTLRNASWTLGNDTRSSVLSCNDTEVESGETVDLTDGNYMFMLPQTLPSTAKVILETEKNTFEGTISGSWSAGQVYTYSINADDAVNYLRFTAIEDGTFTLKLPQYAYVSRLSYSMDEGETWVTTNINRNIDNTITTPVVTAGNSILWKGRASAYSSGTSQAYASKFSSTGKYNISGNIMSLLYENAVNRTDITSRYTFMYLFYQNTNLLDISELIMPATTLANYCYQNMFSGCTNLTGSTPELPATTLASYCYNGMFSNTKITAAPELPATTMAPYCYTSMFSSCKNITVAPELPATTLANYCYSRMFQNCTSLTTAPEIPATSLANYCYQGMFYGTPLTAAPELPATTMAEGCYYEMFNNCKSLTSTPELPAERMMTYCYYHMFYGCTSLTAAPELPATTMAQQCYSGMFYGCTSLTTAPELPATTMANSCYSYMFSGCTSLTTAPELPATTMANYCYSGMFQNCTSLTTAPELPATTMTDYCYRNMFSNCSSLTAAPELPATTLAKNCYESMFSGCRALRTPPTVIPAMTMKNSCCENMFYQCVALRSAPELPATTLAPYCYSMMFRECLTMATAPSLLPATTLASYCYQSMFNTCPFLTTAPELPAETLVDHCYQMMFVSCTHLNYVKAAFTTTPSATYTSSWLSGVPSTGTFVKNAAATWDVTGASGIPSGWTVETYTPE